MTATQKSLLTIGALVVFVGGLYFFTNKASAPSPTASSTPTGQATSTQAQPQLVTPDYKKPIAFSSSASTDVRAQLNTRLAEVQAQIEKSPLTMSAWINLGALHKMGGDYQGAVAPWEFVLSVSPSITTASYNLGDLYQNWLKDYTKAEYYYKEVIKYEPKNVNAYANLYTMYHYTLHDDAKAAAILKQGVAANPGNNYLLELQAELGQ